MKHDWKKHEKQLYSVNKTPSVIKLPQQNVIIIKGSGNPNDDDFSQRVGVLFSLAYSIKMRHKAQCRTEAEAGSEFTYDDYTVYPLEGEWDSPSGDPLNKAAFLYTLMIRQPDFITREMYHAALLATQKKKDHPLLEQVVFASMEGGLYLQVLHLGPFDDEPTSFAKMDEFCAANGLQRTGKTHRELYLNNAKRTAPANYKTILRYPVKKFD